MQWTVFANLFDHHINLCATKPSYRTDAPGSSDDLLNPPWPKASSWKLTPYKQKCTYTNDGNGPGTLSCQGMNAPVSCLGKQDPNNKLECNEGIFVDYYKEIVRCIW